MSTNFKKAGAKVALFTAALIWGSSFLIVKNSMDNMQPNLLIAIRFTISCLLLSVIFCKRLKKINKDYVIKGGIIGFFLFLAYMLQTIGITDTTPGKNAFLTSIYCVIVPFLFWAVNKKKPDAFNIIAAVISMIGIAFVSLNEGFSIGMGDSLTMISGFGYAAHLVAIAKFGREKDPILLTIIQFGFAAVMSWIAAILFHETQTVWNFEIITSVLYLAVFATAIAMLLQNIGQKYTKPAPAAILLSLESVFGVLFSVVFYHEKITIRLFIGFLLIFLAVIISETKLSFLFKNRKDIPEQGETLKA